MEYRVKELMNHNGVIGYFPQKKFLFMWITVRPDLVPSNGCVSKVNADLIISLDQRGRK